jgi:DNA-nicking Smr family endonuclease
MSKLVLDLHEIFNKGYKIDKALKDIMEEALESRVDWVEIIPGKGSGQLKKKVLRFLDQKEIKQMYHRIEKDRDNFGKIFVYFRHAKK